MYMLRLISAVLHEARGSTVSDEALDLRPRRARARRAARRSAARALGVAGGDLAPLVRRRPSRRSRWRSSSSDPHAARRLVRDLDDPRAARRVVRRAARRGARPRAAPPRVRGERRVARLRRRARHVDLALRRRARAATSSSRAPSIATAGRCSRRSSSAASASRRRSSAREQIARPRDEHISEFFSLLARVDGGHGVLRRLGEPDGDVPRARVVLDRALRHVRDRLRRRGLARGRAEVPDHRLVRLGCAALRLGARLRRDGADRLRARSPQPSARTGLARDAHARARPRDDHRRPRLQVFGGAVPHVDARRVRGRADDGDGVHVGGDEGRRVRARVPRARRRRSRRRRTSGRWAFAGHRGRVARDREPRGARAAEREADARVLVDLARRLPADRPLRRHARSADARSCTT